jgi:O-antigen ligase
VKRLNVLDVLLIILVIYVPNQLHFPTDLGLKGMNVLNILLVVTFLAMVVTGARARSPAPLRWRLAFFAVTIFASFVVAQLRAPLNMVADLTVLKSALTYILLYFIFYHGARDIPTSRRLVAVILFVVFVADVEAIHEGLDYGLGNYTMTHRSSGPFGHTYENANRAGVFYALFLPFFVSLMFFRRSRRVAALVGLIGTFCTVFAIFVTYSRQAYLIGAAAILALATKRNVLVGVLAVGLIASWATWAPTAAVERLKMTYVEKGPGDEELEVSAESRFLIWQQALAMIKEDPFGIGLNRFRGEMGKYGDVSEKDAHNSFVLVTAEAGIQGLVALVFVLAGLLGLGLRLVRAARDDWTRTLGYGYTVAVGCLILGNLYGSPVFYGEVMGDFWALSGLVARYPKLLPVKEEEKAPGNGRRSVPSWPRIPEQSAGH